MEQEIKSVLAELGAGCPSETLYESLSPAEWLVHNLLAEGKTCAEIAEYRGGSQKTVDTHRGNLLKKLGLKNAAQLARYQAVRCLRLAIGCAS